MKILSTEGLTKLIQLIKSNFISINDTVITTTVELADVATSGAIGDLTDVEITNVQNEQVLSYNSTTQKWENAAGGGSGGTVDQTFDATSANAQSGIAISGELDKYQEKLTAGNNIIIEEKPSWTKATQVNNLTSERFQNSLAYGNGKFVSISRYGYISTSTDGITWTEDTQISNLNNHNWRAITYGNNKFVAIDFYGYVSTSTDGTTWTEATQSTSLGNNTWWHSIAYGNNKFVAVAIGQGGHVSTSTDGITWTEVVQNTNFDSCESLAYGNNKFVAVVSGINILTSTDGITWTDPSENAKLGINSTWTITFDGTKFVAIEQVYGAISTFDGYNWTPPVFSGNLYQKASWLEGFTFGDNKLVAIGIGDGSYYYTSVCDYSKNSNVISNIFGVDQEFNSSSENAVSGQAIANTFVPKDAGNYHITNSTNGITLTYVDNDSHPTKQYGLVVSEQRGVMTAVMDMTDQTSPKMLMAGLTSDGIMLQNAVTSTTAILGVSSNNNLTVNGVEITSTSIDNTTVTKNTSNELQTVAVIDNNTSNAIKMWTGTKDEYDAIVTKDPHTLYNVTGIETDTDQIITELNNKTNINFNNVTDEAKVLMSGMGMPSKKALSLTIGASGSSVTMPANGWLIIRGKASAANQVISIKVSGNSVYHEEERRSYAADNWITILMPVNAGDTVTYYYSLSANNIYQFQFVYAQGSESEAS